jgi:hypothetical protein
MGVAPPLKLDGGRVLDVADEPGEAKVERLPARRQPIERVGGALVARRRERQKPAAAKTEAGADPVPRLVDLAPPARPAPPSAAAQRVDAG